MVSILQTFFYKIILHRWDLAFIEGSMSDILGGKSIEIKRVNYNFQGRWFADPFILDFNEQVIFLLVEDFSDADKVGKISKLTIDRSSMAIIDIKVILSLPTHLSFPAIIRKNGKIFIYPENSQSGELWLYEYDVNSEQCARVRCLSERPLTDAIYSSCFTEDIIFSTEEPNPNGNKLGIYKLNEKQLYDLAYEVFFEERIGRNAGDFFEYQDNVYRPAQESNKMYGHAISLQKISNNHSSFRFTEVRRIIPPAGAFGIHTFNTHQGLTVIDLKVFRHPWIARPFFWFWNLFK